jgi:hypothetical protein
MFRVRPELAITIRRAALERGLSVQSLILLALRDSGISMLDADLEDLRGRGSGKRQGAAPLRSFPSSAGRAFASPLPETIDDVLVERLAALLARAPAAASQQVTITNCCCRGNPAAEEAATPSPQTMKRN